MQDLDLAFRSLDEFSTPDVWDEALARRARAPRSPRPGHRLAAGAVAIAVFTAAGLLGWHALVPQGGDQPSDASDLGLTLVTPEGWYRLAFTNPTDGVQISNVVLPAPAVPTRRPIHARAALPADGVAMVVYEGTLPGGRTTLPLTSSDFAQTSASAGAPSMGVASFTGNGRTYVVTMEVGPGTSAEDVRLLDGVIKSIGWADGSSSVTETVVLDPPRNTETFAPPNGAPALTANQALAAFDSVDRAFRLPADSTIWLGTYTAAVSNGTYRFRDRLAYGIRTRYEDCRAFSHNPSTSTAPATPCNRWVFIDANTGKMLEALYQPLPTEAGKDQACSTSGTYTFFSCPESGWAKDVAQAARYDVYGRTGSAYTVRGHGAGFYLWAIPLTEEQADLSSAGYTVAEVVEGTRVKTDGVRFTWAVHGLRVWVSAGPNQSDRVTAATIRPLVGSSADIPFART
jgi:hypothetical protein